jgi:NADPH:quinone reductase-like Zn-dependent oxidoreductase
MTYRKTSLGSPYLESHATQVNLRLLTAPMNPADVNQIQGVYPSKPPFLSFYWLNCS